MLCVVVLAITCSDLGPTLLHPSRHAKARLFEGFLIAESGTRYLSSSCYGGHSSLRPWQFHFPRLRYMVTAGF